MRKKVVIFFVALALIVLNLKMFELTAHAASVSFIQNDTSKEPYISRMIWNGSQFVGVGGSKGSNFGYPYIHFSEDGISSWEEKSMLMCDEDIEEYRKMAAERPNYASGQYPSLSCDELLYGNNMYLAMVWKNNFGVQSIREILYSPDGLPGIDQSRIETI